MTPSPWLALIVLTCVACAERPPQAREGAPNIPTYDGPPYDGAAPLPTGIQLRGWDLQLDLTASEAPIRGEVRLDLHLDGPRRDLALHGPALRIRAIRAALPQGPQIGFSAAGPNGGQRLWFDSPLPAGDLSLFITYDFQPQAVIWRGPSGQLGQGAGRPPIPGLDQPNFAAPATITLRHPEGWRVHSPDALDASEAGLSRLRLEQATPSGLRWIAGPDVATPCGAHLTVHSPPALAPADLCRRLAPWASVGLNKDVRWIWAPAWPGPAAVSSGLCLGPPLPPRPEDGAILATLADLRRAGGGPQADSLRGALRAFVADLALDQLSPTLEARLTAVAEQRLAEAFGPLWSGRRPRPWRAATLAAAGAIGQAPLAALSARWLSASPPESMAKWLSALDRPGAAALSAAVDALAQSPAPPRLRFELACGPKATAPSALTVTAAEGAPPAGLPICVKVDLGGALETRCAPYAGPQLEIALPQCPRWLLPDAGGQGGYRWQMPLAATLDLVSLHRGRLSAPERISLPAALIDLRRRGALSTEAMTEALGALASDPHPLVLDGVAAGLALLHRLAEAAPGRSLIALRDLARRHVAPALLQRAHRPHPALTVALLDLGALTPAELPPADLAALDGVALASDPEALARAVERALHDSAAADALRALAARPVVAPLIRRHLKAAPPTPTLLRLSAGLCAPEDGAQIAAAFGLKQTETSKETGISAEAIRSTVAAVDACAALASGGPGSPASH